MGGLVEQSSNHPDEIQESVFHSLGQCGDGLSLDGEQSAVRAAEVKAVGETFGKEHGDGPEVGACLAGVDNHSGQCDENLSGREQQVVIVEM